MTCERKFPASYSKRDLHPVRDGALAPPTATSKSKAPEARRALYDGWVRRPDRSFRATCHPKRLCKCPRRRPTRCSSFSDEATGPRCSASLAGSLHAMAFQRPFYIATQLCAVLLQAPLNGHIIIQLLSTKAGSIARTSLLLAGCKMLGTKVTLSVIVVVRLS
jgi:hypothetical protein